MLVNREEEGNIIECLYKSSNVLASVYDKSKSLLEITFNSGRKYKYFDVPNRDYVRFEIAESQGKIFNTSIKKHKTEKLPDVDAVPLMEQVTKILQENKN